MTAVDSEDVRRHLKGILGLRKDRPGSNLGGEGVLAAPWVPEKLLVSARAGVGGQEAQVSHGSWAAQVRPGPHGPLGIPCGWGTQGGGPQSWGGCELAKGPCTRGVRLGQRAPLDSPHTRTNRCPRSQKKRNELGLTRERPLPRQRPCSALYRQSWTWTSRPAEVLRDQSFTKDQGPKGKLGAERQ